jgi:hypothetical protein
MAGLVAKPLIDRRQVLDVYFLEMNARKMRTTSIARLPDIRGIR